MTYTGSCVAHNRSSDYYLRLALAFWRPCSFTIFADDDPTTQQQEDPVFAGVLAKSEGRTSMMANNWRLVKSEGRGVRLEARSEEGARRTAEWRLDPRKALAARKAQRGVEEGVVGGRYELYSALPNYTSCTWVSELVTY